MRQINVDLIVQHLVNKFGVELEGTTTDDRAENCFFLTPKDIETSEGFKIKVTIGWRSLLFELILGTFAGDLLQHFANAAFEKKALLKKLIDSSKNKNGVFSIKINDTLCDVESIDNWPSEWKQFSFSLKIAPVDIEDIELKHKCIIDWAENYFSCFLALVPLEENEASFEQAGMPEGALKNVLVNKYERSLYNRTLCINYHGTCCKVCDFNFSTIYGKLGSGFIHVHHTTPISKINENYKINPIDDLIPVCPNCHTMLHKKDPPLTVHELKEIITSNKMPF